MPKSRQRKQLIHIVLVISAFFLLTLVLAGYQQNAHSVKPGPTPFTFNQMTAYTVGVLPATGKRQSLPKHTALVYANSFEQALKNQYPHQLTIIAPRTLAKTVGHHQPHQQTLSTFLTENGFIPANQLQQLELIYPHLRYLFVIHIIQDRIQHHQRVHRARYFQNSGNALDQKRNWFATYMSTRELIAKVQVYDLVEQRIAWSNNASVARTTVKNYHQIVGKNARNQQIEQGKHYPKPISTEDIAQDLFGQIITKIPNQ